MLLVCRHCGEYLEYAGEGTDTENNLYDLYFCLECGHKEAILKEILAVKPDYLEWDPPDGSPLRSAG